MFPFFCHLPHWLGQETFEGKKCHLLEATASANLILVWCLDSKAEESINKNWATKCLKVLIWWSRGHLHMRWNQTCNFFEGFCWVWVFWFCFDFDSNMKMPWFVCVCLLHTHVCWLCLLLVMEVGNFIQMCCFFRSHTVTARKRKIRWIL